MFDNFSPRARQVVFIARFKAGERGATAIEVDDFIGALVLEDQGMLESIFSKFDEGQGTVVNSAKPFQTRFGHQQIEPLHLLAATLKKASSQGTKLLLNSGITQEKVL